MSFRFLPGLALLFAAFAQVAASSISLHLADYDAELRGTDKRVDASLLVNRLTELGITTYYWLIWHEKTDWEDLKLFLPKAAEKHISVWVYLVPPTEGPPHGYPASEPFGLDYPRWAEEIARLSMTHINLTGWVIDDFYVNHQLFTPAYIRALQDRAKAINPRLTFLPLMYFPEITLEFAASYGPVIDGVVVAYPLDKDEINRARAILNGEPLAQSDELSCAANVPSAAGDFVSASIPAEVLLPAKAALDFEERDDFTGPTSGYHFKQLLLDETVVWEQDVAGGARNWEHIHFNAASHLGGKTNVIVSFRLFDKKGVSNFPVRWRLKDLRGEGLRLSATLEQPESWRVALKGPLEAGFGPAPKEPTQQRHIPFIVMTAGSADEFRLRHGNPPSPERIADWLRMCLECQAEGRCDGVVTYALDKTAASKTFPLAAKVFHQFKDAGPK